MSRRATVASSSGRASASKASWPFTVRATQAAKQALLVRLGLRAERGEGLAIVLDLQPVEAERRAVDQHRLAGAHGAEGVVVRTERRPVGGLAHGDVERMVVIAGGEHGAPHLEQHEVEGGPEILRQVSLDEGGADGAEIVGEADAHTGLLARLGLRVGTCRRHGRAGDRGRGDAGAVVLAGNRAVMGRCGLLAGLIHGHVLGPDQTLDELHPALTADGDDAAGDGNVPRAGTRRGPRPPRRSRQAGSRSFPLPRRALRSHSSSSMLTSSSWRMCRRSHSAFSSSVVSPGMGCIRPKRARSDQFDFEARLGPLPAGRELVRRRLEPVHGELVEEVRVLEPDAPFVLVREEIAVHDTAGRLVGVHADEGGDRGGGGDAVLGEHAP